MDVVGSGVDVGDNGVDVVGSGVDVGDTGEDAFIYIPSMTAALTCLVVVSAGEKALEVARFLVTTLRSREEAGVVVATVHSKQCR